MEPQDQLKETKTMLRTLLLSTKDGINARHLAREYEEMVGDILPYKKFGHQTLEGFIKALPDVVQVTRKASGEVMLTAVADASTAHILKLVSKQRTDNDLGVPVGQLPGLRVSIMEPQYQLKETKTMLRTLLLSTKDGINARYLAREYEEMVGDILPYKKFGHQTLEGFIKALPDVVQVTRNASGEVMLKAVADASTAHILKLVSKQRSDNDLGVPVGQLPGYQT